MTTLLLTLFLMLLAFVCLALGQLFGRKGLRRGCGGGEAEGAKGSCTCSGDRTRPGRCR